LLRGALSISVADNCYISCPQTKLRVILNYLEEGWLGKTQNKVQGVIYRYNPESEKLTVIKDVPKKDIVARIEGCWQEKIYFTLADSNEPQLLMDLVPLMPVPKIIPPEEEQLPNESRRFWGDVTNAIVGKQYGLATKLKQDLEERQREKAATRKAKNEEWRPRFFTETLTPLGKPDLSEEGERALQGLQQGNFKLEERPEDMELGA